MQFLVFILLLISQTYAYEVPYLKEGESAVLVLSADQLENVCQQQNFSSKCSPRGNCWGINQLNDVLLTRLKFDPNTSRQTSQQITNFLVRAFDKEEKVTLGGFSSLEDFMSYFTSLSWDQDHPLKKAIEVIQLRQKDKICEIIKRRQMSLGHDPRELERTVNSLERILSLGIPIHAGIIDKTFKHAITIVGYVKNKNGKTIKFLVMDSNYPDELQSLHVTEQGWKYEGLLDINEILKMNSLISINMNKFLIDPKYDSFLDELEVDLEEEGTQPEFQGKRVCLRIMIPSQAEIDRAKEVYKTRIVSNSGDERSFDPIDFLGDSINRSCIIKSYKGMDTSQFIEFLIRYSSGNCP